MQVLGNQEQVTQSLKWVTFCYNYPDVWVYKWNIKWKFSFNCNLWWEFLWGNDVLSTYTGDQGLNLLFFNYSCLKSNLVTVNKYQFPRITWHSPAKNYYICPSTLDTLENVKCLLCSKWGEILFCPNHLFCWWILFQ